MRSRLIALGFGLLVPIALAGCTARMPQATAPSDEAQAAGYAGQTVTTQTQAAPSERGPGAEHCADYEQAWSLIASQRLDEANWVLSKMLARFAPFEASGRRVVSFATAAEYDDFVAAGADPSGLEPVDICYALMLGHQGFIAAAKHDYIAALDSLDRARTAAPLLAAPLVEQGYVFRRLGRFAEAHSSYARAVELAERYPRSTDQLPMALRGMGVALIDLQRLDEAEAALRRSLEVDPGNELAEHELRYLDALRSGQH